MIKNVLLPEKIGNYYIFAKRIVGFDIQSEYIFATVSYIYGNSVTIQQCLEVAIEQDNGEEAITRTAQAIKKALTIIGHYSAIHTSISSSQVIFKTMKLPFDDPEKLRRVVSFEVEPLLPFSISEAVIDFIITKQHPDDKSSEVLIAAVQKQYINQTLELFSEAGVQPEVISVDLLQLYAFYEMIPDYSELSGGVVLLDINSHITKIAYILDGQLRFIRTLSFGISHIVRSMSQDLAINKHDVLSMLHTVGFSAEHVDTAYKQSLHKIAELFLSKIQFTLQSFTMQTSPEEQLTHVFLSGMGATFKDFDTWINSSLKVPCTLFNPDKITESTFIHFTKITHIPTENSVSTSFAVPSPMTKAFNFRQKEFAPSDKNLFQKQCLSFCILVILLFSALFMHSFFQIRSLRLEMESSKNETSDLLKEWFPDIESGYIDDMIQEADQETKNEEKLWFSFARSAQNSFLSFLLELSRLDRIGLGLIIDKVAIDRDRGIMILKAQVKDHDALVRLENELRQSKLFTYVQPQDNPNFAMELRFTTGPEGAS